MTPVMSEIAVGTLSEVSPGEGRNVCVHGKNIAIIRTRAGALHAVQAECPHKGGPLADGLVGGTTLICPLHGWKFDMTTGEPLMGDCRIETYPVRADGSGRILITVK